VEKRKERLREDEMKKADKRETIGDGNREKWEMQEKLDRYHEGLRSAFVEKRIRAGHGISWNPMHAKNTQQNMSTLKCPCHLDITKMTKSDQLGPLMNTNHRRSRCRRNPSHIVNTNQLQFHEQYCEDKDAQVCPSCLRTIGSDRQSWMQHFHDIHIHDAQKPYPPWVNISNEEYSQDTRMWARIIHTKSGSCCEAAKFRKEKNKQDKKQRRKREIKIKKAIEVLRRNVEIPAPPNPDSNWDEDETRREELRRAEKAEEEGRDWDEQQNTNHIRELYRERQYRRDRQEGKGSKAEEIAQAEAQVESEAEEEAEAEVEAEAAREE
jgi:hypothetical protein